MPTAQLHTTGTIRFQNFGAGTLETDASGNLTVSSDETSKNDIAPFERALADLLLIEPITFRWTDASGMDTTRSYAGFSAQNVRAAIPEAVGETPDGLLTLSDRPILATAVNAIRQLHAMIVELADKVATLAETITTNRLQATNVETERLCIEDICVTRDQLADMVIGNAVAPTASPTPPEPEDDIVEPEDDPMPLDDDAEGNAG